MGFCRKKLFLYCHTLSACRMVFWGTRLPSEKAFPTFPFSDNRNIKHINTQVVLMLNLLGVVLQASYVASMMVKVYKSLSQGQPHDTWSKCSQISHLLIRGLHQYWSLYKVMPSKWCTLHLLHYAVLWAAWSGIFQLYLIFRKQSSGGNVFNDMPDDHRSS